MGAPAAGLASIAFTARQNHASPDFCGGGEVCATTVACPPASTTAAASTARLANTAEAVWRAPSVIVPAQVGGRPLVHGGILAAATRDGALMNRAKNWTCYPRRPREHLRCPYQSVHPGRSRSPSTRPPDNRP